MKNIHHDIGDGHIVLRRKRREHKALLMVSLTSALSIGFGYFLGFQMGIMEGMARAMWPLR